MSLMKKRENRIKNYFEKKEEVYDTVLDFIESEEDTEIKYEFVSQLITSYKIGEKQEELDHFLQLLLSISNNHQRIPNFFNKIERILDHIKEYIEKVYSNIDIFKLFLSNKRLLLFLFQKGIIKPDEEFVKYLDDLPYYCHFFYHEMKQFFSSEKCQKIEEEMNTINFNNMNECYYYSKRLKGENDTYICSLIRSDSVEEFISHFNRTNFSLSMNIETSIFETNSFLMDKNPTLIEYCAFYGSIKIFNFLKMSNVSFEPSLWLYSIHSNNPDMIHLLEENDIFPFDDTYEECLCESIKCHHNSFARYIEDNLLVRNAQINQSSINTKAESENAIEANIGTELESQLERVISYGFKYYNYKYFPKEFNQKFIFFYLSKYSYLKIVKIFIKTKRKEIKKMKILKI